MKTRKVGLALGSGAARGLAHIGVLKVLEEAGIAVDIIAGTSIGALVGAFYARGHSLDRMESLAVDLGAKRLKFLIDPSLPHTGLVRGKRIERALKEAIGDAAFSDLRIPFVCVATDIETGEEVKFSEGHLGQALRASCSIPVMFEAVREKGRFLVDGGLVNPVPVSVAKAMGADFVIAVNVIPRFETPSKKAPNIFNIIMQTVHVAGYQMMRASLAGADAIIEPKVAGIGYGDFQRAGECIRLGEAAAREAIPEIRRLLS